MVDVLFIYSSLYRVTGLPVGIASIGALLKDNSISYEVFDTVFYPDPLLHEESQIRSDRLMSKEISDIDKILPDNLTSLFEDLDLLINENNPKLIAISVLESTYPISCSIAEAIKKNHKIPIIAGGVFPTLCPELCISNPDFDMICVGEGEEPVLTLTEALIKDEPFFNISGLWVKEGNIIHKNPIHPLHDINKLPFPDFDQFDPRLFYKPMQGKFYKMVNIETSRGCQYNCTYCGAPQLRHLYRVSLCGRYQRNMDMNKIIEQLKFQINRYNPEFIHFSSENFLSLTKDQVNQFCDFYKDIKIPFWIQTRIETIDLESLSKLREVGLFWLTLGLEHGNEEFRRKYLKRTYTNEYFLDKMDIIAQLNMGASINNMIGFPDETQDMMMDTVEMNRKLYQRNKKIESNIFLFIPFRGCELYTLCLESGLISSEDYCSTEKLHVFGDKSMLKFSEEHNLIISGLLRTFNLYVRLPKSYYNEIKRAEIHDEFGDLELKRFTKIAKELN